MIPRRTFIGLALLLGAGLAAAPALPAGPQAPGLREAQLAISGMT